MPTVFGYHDVKDRDHWLASPKREEFFGPLGVTNIRTFVDPTNATRVGVLFDVADMDVVMVVSGTGVIVEEVRGEWARVTANKTGWMRLALLRAVSELPTSVEEKRKLLVEDSAHMMGVPYLWGGATGHGIDCSGFTRLLYRWIGIEFHATQICNTLRRNLWSRRSKRAICSSSPRVAVTGGSRMWV